MILVKKIEGFPCIVFIKNRSKKVFADVLDRKEAFKDYRKIWLGKNATLEFFQGG